MRRPIKSNRFLVLGRAGMDLYADPPGTQVEEARQFVAALGGSAANIAVAIAKLGGTASLISAVSDDAVGRFTLNELRRYGVGSAHVAKVGGEARNSLAVVETRANNTQSVIYRNNAADFQLAEEQMHAVAWADFDALIVTGTSLAVEPSRAAAFLAVRLARMSGLTTILDVDYRPYSWISREDASFTCARAAVLSDIVIANDDEFAVLVGPDGDGLALALALTAHSEIVVYKMGERGCVTFSEGGRFETGVFPVEALKPTGAGDAFMGSFVTSLAAGFALKDCVRRGAAAAAIVVTRVGCAPASPTLAELEEFMSAHALAH